MHNNDYVYIYRVHHCHSLRMLVYVKDGALVRMHPLVGGCMTKKN